MPTTLQEMHTIVRLDLYNSTMVAWDASAALTTAAHPRISTFIAAWVNYTGALLPPGLLRDNHPQSLNQVQICVSNLVSLPDDLPMRWPKVIFLMYFEFSAISRIPPSMVTMYAASLSIARNNISTIPEYMIFNKPIYAVNLAQNLWLNKLPAVIGRGSIGMLSILRTNVATTPAWPTETTLQESIVMAAESPLCANTSRAGVDPWTPPPQDLHRLRPTWKPRDPALSISKVYTP